MQFSILIITAASLFIATNSAFDAETELLIDHLVEDFFMENNRIPGMGLSVVRNGTVLMSKGYGLRNISAGLASDENTLFAIGSITKTFVAVLVVKTLNELFPQRGAAVLDIPIAELIPSTVNFTLSDRYRAEQTTFRDILSHRTCLLSGQIEVIFGTIPSASEYAYRSRYLPEVCEFRNGFDYNNNMHSLAGEIISAIKETSLQNMVISLARDIGMDKTTYIDFDGIFESHPNMSQPYLLKNSTLVEFDIFQIRKTHMALGSSGMLSTSTDMAKYMDFHLNLGRVGDRQIVPMAAMSWLYTISNSMDFQGSRTQDSNSIIYGDVGTTQGFFSTLYDGWNIIRHTGYWPPYHCDMRLFPATRIGVFLCTNGPGFISNIPVPSTVALNIFELVRENGRSPFAHAVVVGNPIAEHQLIMKGRQTNRTPTALNYNQLRNRVETENLLGVYGHPYNGDIYIRYAPDNTTLQLYFSEWAHGRLQPVSGSSSTTFDVLWDATIMDHFYSYPGAVPNFWIDFGIVDKILFRVGESNSYNEFEFVKNATLDTFPSIPWLPNSCGPER